VCWLVVTWTGVKYHKNVANEKKSKIRTAILRSNSILDDAELVLDVTPNRAMRLYVGQANVREKDLRYFVISNSPLLGGEIGEISIGDVAGLQDALDTKANDPVELDAVDIAVIPYFYMTAGIGSGWYRNNGTTNAGRSVFEKLGGDPLVDNITWTGSTWRTRSTDSPRIDKLVYEDSTDVH